MSRSLLCAMLVASVACSRAPTAPPWATAAATMHAQTDHLIDSGDRAGARRVLEALAQTLAAANADIAEPRRELLQDTRFRLAQLALDAREAETALHQTELGLALGGGEDLFVANLLVARGAAREALGQTADALGDYARAQAINAALLERTLGGK